MRCPAAFAFPFLTFATVAPTQQLLLSSSYGAPTSPTASAPSVPLVDGNRAWFTAVSRDHGRQIWVTDGTTAGTHMAFALSAAVNQYRFPLLAAGQGNLLFSDGGRIWISDGTLPGTRALSAGFYATTIGKVGSHAMISMNPQGGSQTPSLLSIDLRSGAIEDFTPLWVNYGVQQQDLDGQMYLNATALGGTLRTWVTDGTLAGTRMLQTLDGTPVLARGNFAAFRGSIYFEGSSDNLSSAFYRIPKESTSAERLFASGAIFLPLYYLTPTRNGIAYFRLGQLWVTDGTASGTQQLAVPGNPYEPLATLGGRVVFSGNTPAHNSEPWISDGTVAGTHELIDLNPGAGSSYPSTFRVAGDRMFFDVTVNGVRSLQRTDGTAQGTITAAMIPNGPQFVVAFGDGMLYADGSDQSGRNLWFADGDAPPRQLTQSFMERALIPNAAPWNRPLTQSIRGTLIFQIYETANGGQLWRSDGTPAGTSRLCDLFLGTDAYCLLGIPLGDRMLFYGQTSAGGSAYMSDGTALGTMLTDIPREAVGLPWVYNQAWIPLGDVALLQGYYDVYHTDGTGAGTSRFPFPQSGFGGIVVATSDLVFAHCGATELWCSDGSAAGTRRVDDNVFKLIGSLGADALYISYGYPQAPGLYASNGGLPRFLAPVPPVGLEWGFVWNNQYWFWNGQLWHTDGTAAGTVAVPYNVSRPVPGPDALYYVDSDPDHGSELWRTDGAPAGTWRVTDLMPGPMDGVLAVSAVGDRLFLTARDPTGGTEPWISDGTAAGTFRLADITPGSEPSNPVFLGVAGEYLYFFANEGERNVGLYSVRLRDLGIAQRERLGAGCLGSAGRPTLDCSAFPHVGDGSFRFDLQHAPALAPVFLMLGTEHGITSLGPCVVRTAGDIAVLGTNASFNGHAAWPQPIPALPSLIGVSLTAQAVVIDAGAPGPGFSVSDALLLVIGE